MSVRIMCVLCLYKSRPLNTLGESRGSMNEQLERALYRKYEQRRHI